MLTLTRKAGQVIIIEGLGRITVIDIKKGTNKPGRVSLAFEFDRSIRIDREEVVKRRAAEAAEKGGGV